MALIFWSSFFASLHNSLTLAVISGVSWKCIALIFQNHCDTSFQLAAVLTPRRCTTLESDGMFGSENILGTSFTVHV